MAATITGTAVNSQGVALTSGVIQLESSPRAVVASGASTIFPSYIEAEIGAAGAVEFDAEPGDYVGLYYPGAATGPFTATFLFTVPDEEAATFNECLVQAG